jgi:hypothetical protein
MPANDGPDDWQRIEVTPDLARREGQPGEPGRRVDIVVPTTPIRPVALPAVTVSGVDMGQDSIEFDVDQVGVPVLVKVSYFPNWTATGAEGPFRVGPNMMVVVPQSTHVELHYGRTAIDYLTILLTLVGIGLCFVWRRSGDVRHAGPVPVGFGTVPVADDIGAPAVASAGSVDDWRLEPRVRLDDDPDVVAAPHHGDTRDGPGDRVSSHDPDDAPPSFTQP